MSIPASLAPITVTARYHKPDGSAAAGLVRFQLSAPGQVPVDGAIVPQASVKATLDQSGAISVVLAASDDPDWAPTGLTYQVTERIVGADPRTYDVNIPAAAAGGTVDLATLAPAVPGPVLVAYVLAAAVGAPGGVASLDVTGQVPASQLGNVPGGGGGGAVTSVNGEVGVVVLDAADVGADPAGTAAGQVAAHTAAVDPHGDRAHAAGLVDDLDQALTSAVAGKANTGHTHPQSDVVDLAADLAGKAAAVHQHGADDITSGTLAVARLPVGAGADTVAAGDHVHGTPPVPYAVLAFSQAGVVAATPGTARIYNDSGRALTIRAVRVSVGTAPTGAALIVDVKKSGATIFTTTGNRPTIAAGANTSGKVTNMDVTTLADGDYLTVDVAQVGSTTAGSDLTVQIWAA